MWIVAVSWLVWLWASPARACATAPPRDASVEILGEDAIIIWDPAKKQQQFIRRADFRSPEAADFGFLVPTPTVPEMSEAPDELFERLRTFIDPGEVDVTEYAVMWTLCGGFFLMGTDRAAKSSADAGVQVLVESRVAGYDVTSLKATDTDALAQWLEQHHYSYRPALKDWLDHYVKAGWIINAFKIAKQASEVVGSQAVRMTFTTDRPYFPYREPEDAAARWARQLRIYLLTPERYDAEKVGDQDPAQHEGGDHPQGPGLDAPGICHSGRGYGSNKVAATLF
jgi:hypothetical protein